MRVLQLRNSEMSSRAIRKKMLLISTSAKILYNKSELTVTLNIRISKCCGKQNYNPKMHLKIIEQI